MNKDVSSTQDNALDLIEELYWSAALNEGNELYFRVEKILLEEGRLSVVVPLTPLERKHHGL